MDETAELSEQSAEARPERRITHDQVLAAARDLFVEGEIVDMHDLATRLGVSRATLYRITSGRERLLADVVWSLSLVAVRWAARSVEEPPGPEKVLATGRLLHKTTLSSEPMRRFVVEEPSIAAAALHTPCRLRDQLVDEWRRLLVEATEATGSSLTMDHAKAAEVIVALGASALYDALRSEGKGHDDLVQVVVRSLFS
jgi:AcrR family transcriptional regulator